MEGVRSGLRWVVGRFADLVVQLTAIFAAINVAAGWVRPELDCNWIWIDLSGLAQPLATGLLSAFAVGVIGFRVLPRRGRLSAVVIAVTVGVLCLADAAVFYRLLAAERIATTFPIPLSLGFGVMILCWSLDRREDMLGRRQGLAITPAAKGNAPVCAIRCVCLAVLAVGCLYAHLVAFGATDYRRRADVIVAFGAGVRPDGHPTLALYDRTRSACDLYLAGYADRVIFSGGRNPRVPISEPQAMRRVALKMGVPDEAIILDEGGVNSVATVRNTAELCRRHGWNRVLMVSHDYHLARIKLLSRRAGLRAYTVAADETRPLRRKVYYVCRELAAFAWWYAKPLAA